eukprot:2378821-Rhodomonas_salina.6
MVPTILVQLGGSSSDSTTSQFGPYQSICTSTSRYPGYSGRNSEFLPRVGVPMHTRVPGYSGRD